MYSVDLTWEDMTFTYNESGSRTWDPDTHTYTDTTSAGWDKVTAAVTAPTTPTPRLRSNSIIPRRALPA